MTLEILSSNWEKYRAMAGRRVQLRELRRTRRARVEARAGPLPIVLEREVPTAPPDG